MDRAALYARFKDDWRFAEAVEEVAWTPKGGSAVTGIKATRGDIDDGRFRFMGQEFMDLSVDTVLLLWDSTITGAARPSGDKATLVDAAGQNYTVEYAKQVAYDTQWLVGLKRKA